jgi:6-phosphogluconolactonase
MPIQHTYTRRSFLQHLAGVATLPLLAACATGRTLGKSSDEVLLYVGTYGAAEQDNLFLYRLNAKTGALTRLGGFRGGVKPGYLTLDAAHRRLFAINASRDYQGEKSGAVCAFTIDQQTGGLTLLNRVPSRGEGPCYISLAPDEKSVLVANYFGGNIGSFPVQTDGQLADAAVVDQHVGSGPHRNQDVAHAHCILPDPAGRYALAVDLGTDQILSYALSTTGTPLQVPPQVAYTTQRGAGPRHLTFHPNQKWAYLINELNSTMTALAYDAASGRFTELHTASALPAGFTGENSCADVHVSPDGRFVYGSNRGHDSIAVFAIDPSNGHMTLVEHVSTQGKTPRNFAIDPTGRILLVANQNSDNIVTYHINQKTGRLSPTGNTATAPAPVCLKLLADFTAR